jgi:hypothetical protein
VTAWCRLVLLAPMLLSACVESRFESPLGDNIETCDAAWKGIWTDTGSTLPKEGAGTAFYVNDDCEFTLLEQPEPGGAFKRIRVPVNYVHSAGKDYVVVADTAIRALLEVKPVYGVDPAPSKAFFYASYRVHGDRLEMFQVDDVKLAGLVIDGKVDGTVDKRANELHVFVRGSRAQMLDLVRTHDIFESRRSAVLQRSGQSIEAFERAHQGDARSVHP